ncbi:MAG TPA: SGNH/GDSL hydrolase family protein [Candidatus Hydrogenedens sp.]|nr:SGNH/GDSL hydrolase family protein [Candidatus Hydrogenedens sp.]
MNETAKKENLSKKKIVLFTFLPLVILLLSLELIARVVEIWLPPLVTDIGLGFTEDSRLFIPDPYDSRYLITHPNKTVAFQNQRFLKNKPSGTLRIFFLGGSSVNYVHYELPNLSERLKENLKPKYKNVEIINCGGLSYGTHRLVLIAREIVNYEPDLVMIYSGHNEFEEIEQLHLARIQSTKLQKILYSSAMMRFIRDRIATYQISQLEKEHNRRILAQSLPDAGKGWNHVFTPQEIAERMEKYKNNLNEIIQLCKEKNIKVIIATVPSNYIKPNLIGKSAEEYEQVLQLIREEKYKEVYELGRKIIRETSPRHQSSDLENNIVRELAETNHIPLADVLSAVEQAEPHHIPGETLFNDHCHLNPEGNKIMIHTFEEKILQALSE